MFSTLLAAGFQVAAAEPESAPQPTLDGQEQSRYLEQIKKLYLTGSDRQALLEHSNALLRSYAFRADYQVGQPQRLDVLYQLSVAESGELLVRKETRNQGNIAVTHERFPVFGVDPYIRYTCADGGLTCEIRNPADGRPWLTIVRDHQGAAELARALSFLIRNLQRGVSRE